MAEGRPFVSTDNSADADSDRSCEQATERIDFEMAGARAADDAALQRFLQQQRR